MPCLRRVRARSFQNLSRKTILKLQDQQVLNMIDAKFSTKSIWGMRVDPIHQSAYHDRCQFKTPTLPCPFKYPLDSNNEYSDAAV